MNKRFIYKIFFWGDKSVFDIPANKQRDFLNKLGEARDNFERSYKQYLCQNYFKNKTKIVGLNVISAFVLPFLLFYNLLKNARKIQAEFVDALGDFQNFEEVIPRELSTIYKINNRVWFSGSSLSNSDLFFIWKVIFLYPFSPFFSLKIAYKISRYSFMIKKFQPRAIIVHNEFSFTSSILTEYCNMKGIKHINVMHGEKLFFIRDSYFNYDQCYVWNEFYKNLFISLSAAPLQFILAVPPSMKFDCNDFLDSSLYADYKYYLATCTEQQIKSIIASMQFAKKLGKRIVYRLHPRYSDISLIEKYISKENIEYPDRVSIQASISNAGKIVGSYTTVLNQAHAVGKHIIFDDVTFLFQYKKLKGYKYIFSERNENIQLLSEIQDVCKQSKNGY